MSDELQIYEVLNTDTGMKSYQAATNAEDACTQAGWQREACYVVAQTPRRPRTAENKPGLLVHLPSNVCPYQYAECTKPENEVCPHRPDSPELSQWLKQVGHATTCPHKGIDLAASDYRLGQKWLPLTEAITELSSKPSATTPNLPQPTCQAPLPTP
ncbi:hypothetical protein ES703_97430 [subsurface metagenome]